jgi:catechol 2,3-dioxygenase-like lactoylglutathione lyase family enzyme
VVRPAEAGPASPASLLGGERGLDHVNLATRDLEAVTRTLEQRLGFGPAIRGQLPNGLANANYYFEDASYLEVLAATDPQGAPWVPRFLERGPGLMKLVLAVHSAEESAAFLRQRGVDTLAPVAGTIQHQGKRQNRGELWRKLLFHPSPLPCDCMFLIAYDAGDRAALLRNVEDGTFRLRFRHPNTARGLRAVYWAVPDLDAAARGFTRIGLTAGPAFPEPRFQAQARRVEAGIGEILLLAPTAKDGPTARYLEGRGGSGLFGASIAVRELEAARRLAEAGTGRSFPPGRAPLGPAILIPPEVAHGAWIELVEGPAVVRGVDERR